MKDDVKKQIDAGNKALAVFDYKGALSKFKKARTLDPNEPAAHFGYAEAALGVEKISEDEIIDAYKKAISLELNNAFYHARLGAFYLDIGKYEEAEAYYDNASRVDPDGSPYYWTELAIGLYQNWAAQRGEEATPEEEKEILSKVLNYLIRSVNIDKKTALELLK